MIDCDWNWDDDWEGLIRTDNGEWVNATQTFIIPNKRLPKVLRHAERIGITVHHGVYDNNEPLRWCFKLDAERLGIFIQKEVVKVK
jgi:hypothetical protein